MPYAAAAYAVGAVMHDDWKGNLRGLEQHLRAKDLDEGDEYRLSAPCNGYEDLLCSYAYNEPEGSPWSGGALDLGIWSVSRLGETWMVSYRGLRNKRDQVLPLSVAIWASDNVPWLPKARRA